MSTYLGDTMDYFSLLLPVLFDVSLILYLLFLLVVSK